MRKTNPWYFRDFYDFPADIRVDYIITDIDTMPGNAFVSKEMLGNNKFIEAQQADNNAEFWKDYNILLPDYNTAEIAKEIQTRNESFSLKGKMESKLKKIRGDESVKVDSICSYYHNMGSFNGSVLIKYKGKTILAKGYGYGWMIDKKMFRKSQKHTIIYHPGTDFGYYSMFVRQPDDHILVILLSNTGDFPGLI